MSELITAEIFTDGQQNINAANMNGIIGNATVQPDVILNKPASVTMDVADQFLVLKTDNTLAKSRFDTIVNSTSSTLPVADSTKNGMLRQVSGKTTDFVDGTNTCQPLSNFLPPGVIMDYAGASAPAGWLTCTGQSLLRTDYPDLYAAIGVTFGSVDGTHFSLPDFTGRISAAAGGSFGALGLSGGAASVVLQVDHLPSHSHPITDVTHTHTSPAHNHSDSGHVHPMSFTYQGMQAGATGVYTGSGTNKINTDPATCGLGSTAVNINDSMTGLTTTQAIGSGTAVPTLPPYLTLNKIIKI